MCPVAANELSGRGRLRQLPLPAEAEPRVGDGVGAQQEHQTEAAAQVEEALDLVGRGPDNEVEVR